jgi:hypothetical protein
MSNYEEVDIDNKCSTVTVGMVCFIILLLVIGVFLIYIFFVADYKKGCPKPIECDKCEEQNSTCPICPPPTTCPEDPSCPTCPPPTCPECPTCPACPPPTTCPVPPTCPSNPTCPDCVKCEKMWVTHDGPIVERELTNKITYNGTVPMNGKLIGMDIFASGWLNNGYVHFIMDVGGNRIFDGSFNHSPNNVAKKYIEFNNIPVKQGDSIYLDWSTMAQNRNFKVLVNTTNVPFIQFYTNTC